MIDECLMENNPLFTTLPKEAELEEMFYKRTLYRKNIKKKLAEGKKEEVEEI